MSDTDKDKPHWVTARWVAEHTIRCSAGRQLCNLTRDRRIHSRWQHRGTDCTWVLDGGRRQSAPPAWFINHVWSGMDRCRSRGELTAARAEYRATGEVETEPTVDQHRHGALWDWN